MIDGLVQLSYWSELVLEPTGACLGVTSLRTFPTVRAASDTCIILLATTSMPERLAVKMSNALARSPRLGCPAAEGASAENLVPYDNEESDRDEAIKGGEF